MLRATFLLLLVFALTHAQFNDGSDYRKTDLTYGEQTVVNQDKVTHYNPKLKSYHELVVGSDGLVLNWEKGYDSYGNEVKSSGTHNLRYGSNFGSA